MSKRSLTEVEIENVFYANSESEDEFDFGETDVALEVFEIEPQKQGKIGNLFRTFTVIF